jgi:hypothetical protein
LFINIKPQARAGSRAGCQYAQVVKEDKVLKALYSILFDHVRYLAFEGADSLHYAQAFRRHFFLALGGSAVAVAIAVGIAAMAGRIGWTDPITWNKALSTSGAFFAAWGTWFGVTERNESWKKERMDERLRDRVFGATFVPGVILGALGALW